MYSQYQTIGSTDTLKSAVKFGGHVGCVDDVTCDALPFGTRPNWASPRRNTSFNLLWVGVSGCDLHVGTAIGLENASQNAIIAIVFSGITEQRVL